MLREPQPISMEASPDDRQPLLPGVDESRARTRAEQFDEEAIAFLREHPVAWKLFCHYTAQAVAVAGHVGVGAVVERLRWESSFGDSRFAIEASTGKSFKLNNNHRASFARIYEATFPEHAGVFAKRVRKSEKTRAA